MLSGPARNSPSPSNPPRLDKINSRNGIGTIHYTLDGSEPNESSPIYSSPIQIHETTTIKAKTYWGDENKSEVAQLTFRKNYGE